MATLTSQEKNYLRKAVRLLDLRENRGQPAYDHTCDLVLAGLREMLQPTEKYKLHLPEEYAFELSVAWYEIDANGIKHLYLTVTEEDEAPAPPDPGEVSPPRNAVQGGGSGG